jgi:hypothetical protein
MYQSLSKSAILILLFAILSGCASMGLGTQWTTLIDGNRGLENFNLIGENNWSARNGAIEANRSSNGSTFLVSRETYRDFELRVEFWTSHDGNSGVFIRCENSDEISSGSCYEVNIYDQRPDPSYGTGGIVDVAAVSEPRPMAGGKWNTYMITARGDHLVAVLNGRKTADVRDNSHDLGVFALQWGNGTIRFRKVQIRRL